MQGEAQHALDGISVTEANYDTAWFLLSKRYDNKRLLVQENLSALIPIVQEKEESANELQNLLDTLVKKRDSLKILGRPVDQ